MLIWRNHLSLRRLFSISGTSVWPGATEQTPPHYKLMRVNFLRGGDDELPVRAICLKESELPAAKSFTATIAAAPRLIPTFQPEPRRL
jgi:hypothetical protein